MLYGFHLFEPEPEAIIRTSKTSLLRGIVTYNWRWSADGWRVADSLSLRRLLKYGLDETTPDHVTISRTRRLLDEATHQAVFTFVLAEVARRGMLKGKTIGSTRRRWKPMRRCARSCGGTPARATWNTCSGWQRKQASTPPYHSLFDISFVKWPDAAAPGGQVL
jgi:hypothetical protein